MKPYQGIYLHPEAEERFCTCGASHGSLEGHLDWCDWLLLHPVFDALSEVLNWYTPPNDSKPFPIEIVADASNRITEGENYQ